MAGLVLRQSAVTTEHGRESRFNREFKYVLQLPPGNAFESRIVVREKFGQTAAREETAQQARTSRRAIWKLVVHKGAGEHLAPLCTRDQKPMPRPEIEMVVTKGHCGR